MTAEHDKLEANQADVLEQSLPAEEQGNIQTGGAQRTIQDRLVLFPYWAGAPARRPQQSRPR